MLREWFDRLTGGSPGRKRSPSRRSASKRGRDPIGSAWRGPLLAALIVLLSLLLPSGPWMPREELRHRVDPACQELVAQPDWCERQITNRIAADLAILAPLSLRDEDELAALVEEVKRASGWIAGVHHVEKIYPQGLELHLDLREPLALVQSQAGLYLVDRNGFVLGPAREAPELLRNLRPPLIFLPASRRPARLGPRITQRRLHDGLLVAAAISGQKEVLERRGIDIALIDLSPMFAENPGSQSDIDLYTRGGVRIEWGRSQSSDRAALDPSPATKIRHILRAAAQFPGLRGVSTVRVQFEDPALVSVILAEPPSPEEVIDQWPQRPTG